MELQSNHFNVTSTLYVNGDIKKLVGKLSELTKKEYIEPLVGLTYVFALLSTNSKNIPLIKKLIELGLKIRESVIANNSNGDEYYKEIIETLSKIVEENGCSNNEVG